MRLILFCLLLLPGIAGAQLTIDSTAFLIRDIYRQSYTELKAYEWLTTLCKDIGHRLSGSEGAERAVEWSKSTMDTFGLDKVWLQPTLVPHWERGGNAQVIMISPEYGAQTLMALALGNSPGTPKGGVRAEVIEVQTIDELRAMPDEKVKGKIIFFNRAMDMGQLNTFAAYGNAADQRYSGPHVAGYKGAVGVAIRSLSSRQDDYPHTGSTFVSDTSRNIPSVALSTNDAVRLSKAIKAGPTELFIETHGKMLEDKMSYNVIGEIKGTISPDTIILVGGHLDSWDVGDGAQDDGSGCVHSMEVLYRLKKINYKPRYTIRCVLFMNEENGLRGGLTYADSAISKNEFHMVAIESDGGAGMPTGFGVSAGEHTKLDEALSHMGTFISLLEPYGIGLFPGGGGADIGPLKPKAGLLIGLRPQSARYFDYHHADNDVLETVHPRELAAGSAALTTFIILLDQYGIYK
jgi:carboxypeptidase Q